MKKALVTGGTKGIGLAIAQALLEDNYYVITNYAFDTENAQMIQNKWQESYPDRFYIMQMPMEKEEDVQTFMEACSKEDLLKGGFDAIVLNAGCTDRTSWSELSNEMWNHVMNVNLNVPAGLLRALDPHLNHDASVLFISSAMSVIPHAISVPYLVSKAAINGLTMALVKEYADRKIRVNAILPGFADTSWHKGKAADHRKRITDKVALHRFAAPEEIADMALSIIHSTYMNGSLVRIDGGYCYK